MHNIQIQMDFHISNKKINLHLNEFSTTSDNEDGFNESKISISHMLVSRVTTKRIQMLLCLMTILQIWQKMFVVTPIKWTMWIQYV